MFAAEKSEVGLKRRSRSSRGLLAVQLMVITLAAITFAMLPPDKGPILLVALGEENATQLVGPDLRLVGAGRLPRSLVVMGLHPSFARALFDHGVLILPAVPMLCGSADRLES
jgi:hypothetical protein